MGRSRVGAVLVAAALLAGLGVIPETASAVLSGKNGMLLFVSGRGETDDLTAKLYLRPPFGLGGVQPIPTATGAGQHRHPTWSPDRTKIAYARGANDGTANYDIFILDLTNPGATPQNITNSNNVTDDRPAWSPDGERVAFESENADASGQLNIKLYNVGTGNTTNFTSINAGTYEHKPAWTPDSQTLYYAIGDPNGTNMDIVRQPAAGGTQSNVLADPTANEFQPSISPDGTKMCFTRGTGSGFNSTARVRVALANGGGQMELPGNLGVAGYNCTWSPDGAKIAYVQGTFSTGDLWMENSDLSGGLQSLETTTARFDGNPDWAPDGRPQCDDQTVNTKVNTPVQVPLSCEDTGPAYERTDLIGFVPSEARPSNGTVDSTDPRPLPSSVTYTPNAGFSGTDSFQVRSLDLVSFGDRNGTVTVNVRKQLNGFEIVNVKKKKKKGTAELTVSVDEGPGQLALGSKKIKAVEAPVGAGENVTQTLLVKAIGKAKKKLKKKGKAKVTAGVTYSPDLGDPSTESRKIGLKRKKRR